MLRHEWTPDVSCKQMTDVRLGHIRRLVESDPQYRQLTCLHLYDNRLTSEGMHHVCRLNSGTITTVWLGHNRIRDAGIATLVAAPWPHLQHLFLDDNYIGDDGALLLVRLPAVRRLGLHTNCLTERSVRCLQRQAYDTLWTHSQRVPK